MVKLRILEDLLLNCDDGTPITFNVWVCSKSKRVLSLPDGLNIKWNHYPLKPTGPKGLWGYELRFSLDEDDYFRGSRFAIIGEMFKGAEISNLTKTKNYGEYNLYLLVR